MSPPITIGMPPDGGAVIDEGLTAPGAGTLAHGSWMVLSETSFVSDTEIIETIVEGTALASSVDLSLIHI